MKFTLQNMDPKDMVLEKIEFIAPEGVNIGGTYSIDFAPGGVLTPKQASSRLTVAFGGSRKTLAANASADVYVVMPPFELAAGSSFTIQVHTDEGIIERTTVPAAAKSFRAGTLNTAVIPLRLLRLNHTDLILNMGKSIQLEVLNSTPDMGAISWKSSEPRVATVDEKGLVRAVSSGNAVITATFGSSDQLFRCKVMVIGKEEIAIMADTVPIVMVKVPQGTYFIGSNSSGPHAYWQPEHVVRFSESYCIGKYEVTQELWEAVMGANPSQHTGNLQLPVDNLSWEDICGTGGFLQKLNELTGKKFVLPTEAQWEVAAKGATIGVQRDFLYSGSNNVGEVAWFTENSYNKEKNKWETQPVGTKAPNQLGIHDMSGNVWEWCSDWYGSYSKEDQIDPTGPASGTERVSRGGGIRAGELGCRIIFRIGGAPDSRDESYGFRLAILEKDL